ncbi:MAG: putative nitrogen fixation protein NifT [Pseudomonadota bacterium]|nr:putative nitrogen fixation protein NifT [Pseudomonadota bacterium]
MPNVMIRQTESGGLTLYVAKKDLEESVVSIEHNTDDCWGGEITLADGSSYYIEPMSEVPSLPITVRAKRGAGG